MIICGNLPVFYSNHMPREKYCPHLMTQLHPKIIEKGNR